MVRRKCTTLQSLRRSHLGSENWAVSSRQRQPNKVLFEQDTEGRLRLDRMIGPTFQPLGGLGRACR